MKRTTNSKSAGFKDSMIDAAVLGTGAVSAYELINEIRNAIEERRREKARKNPKPNDDTIVITLPKTASARESFENVKSDSVEKLIPLNETSTPRETNGRFAPSWTGSKTAGSETVNALINTFGDIGSGYGGVIGATAGLYGGAVIAKAVINRIHKARKARELEAAKISYIDTLKKQGESYTGETHVPGSNVSKVLTYLDSLGAAATRTASETTGGTLAVETLAALATAYLTDKYLENKFGKNEAENKKRSKPKVVFRTVEASDHSSEIDPSTALSAIILLKEAAAAGDSYFLPVKTAQASENNKQKLKNYDQGYVDWLSNPHNAQFAINNLSKQKFGIEPSKDAVNYANEGMGWWRRNFVKAPQNAANFNKYWNSLGQHGQQILLGRAIKQNPELVNVLNAKYNTQFRDGIVNSYFDNANSKSGLIGGMFNSILRWLYNNTQFGKNFVVNRMLNGGGIGAGQRIQQQYINNNAV